MGANHPMFIIYIYIYIIVKHPSIGVPLWVEKPPYLQDTFQSFISMFLAPIPTTLSLGAPVIWWDMGSLMTDDSLFSHINGFIDWLRAILGMTWALPVGVVIHDLGLAVKPRWWGSLQGFVVCSAVPKSQASPYWPLKACDAHFKKERQHIKHHQMIPDEWKIHVSDTPLSLYLCQVFGGKQRSFLLKKIDPMIRWSSN